MSGADRILDQSREETPTREDVRQIILTFVHQIDGPNLWVTCPYLDGGVNRHRLRYKGATPKACLGDELLAAWDQYDQLWLVSTHDSSSRAFAFFT